MLGVLSFNAATSVCEKGRQWRRLAPLLNEMRQGGECLASTHSSQHERGWAVAACGTIAR
eukprot:5563299-Karenia_brevis.AAC.1